MEARQHPGLFKFVHISHYIRLDIANASISHTVFCLWCITTVEFVTFSSS